MRISSGVSGLDYILSGGLLGGRAYLVYGEPGTGKTTLGMHFLSAGQRGLLITLGQSAENLRNDARSLGLNLDKISVLDLTPSPEAFTEMQTYDIFLPADVEREPISRQIVQAIHDTKPDRIYVDSFGQFRNLVADAFQYRRLAQSFFRFATQRGATLIVGSHDHECARDVDGVIFLDCSQQDRTIRVLKFRGSDFHAGHHAMQLTSAGLQIPLSAA